MKEVHKIYLTLWGFPLVLLLFSLLLTLFFLSKKTEKVPPEISISSNYLQLMNEFNKLNLPERPSFLWKNKTFVDPFKLKTLETKKPSFTPETMFSLHLSMIYVEGNKKVCMINNKRFRERDYVEKNVKIIKIGDYYVDLQIGNKIKRLLLGQNLTF